MPGAPSLFQKLEDESVKNFYWDLPRAFPKLRFMHFESLNNGFRDVVLEVKVLWYTLLYTLIQSLCYSEYVEIKEFAIRQSTQVLQLLTYILVFIFSYSSAISKVQEQWKATE